MDIGMLVMDQVLGEAYGAVHEKITSHEELAAAERADVGGDHPEVAGWLAEQWKLPPLLSTPISQHHNSSSVQDAVLYRLTEVVSLGGRCADVFVDENAAPAIAEVRQRFAKLCKLSEADSDALLADIGQRTKEVASLFEINIGTTSNFEAILKRANEALVDITLQSQMQATQLKEQNTELKKAATTDALTGLSNRAHFDQFMTEQFATAVVKNQQLSLLLLDVDKFKSVNDKHGHPAGDAVLRHLGKLLRSAARQQDLAARYGGEELCLVLPDTPRAVAATVAESVRRAIAAKPIPIGNGSIKVTASVGVATFEPGGVFREVAHLLKAADLSVYAAKRSGRNCVRVFTLPATVAPKAA
jgi:diguanylate cyclase (GGDEF)-like protein